MRVQVAIDNFTRGYFSTCQRSTKTRDAYVLDLAQFQKHVGDSTLDKVNVDRIEDWARELKSKGYAPASIRRKLATLRVFLSYWVRKGKLTASPLWRIRLDLGKQTNLPRNLTASDSKLLIEAAWARTSSLLGRIESAQDRRFLALRDLAAIEILFATGLRVGELVSLKIPDWREEEASFLVKGKGSKERLAFLPDARSVAAISSYLSLRNTLTLQHDHLLINARGDKLSTQGVSRILIQLSTHGNVQTHVTPHMIRHTVATLLLRHGADIRVVQEVLGHASIMTTQRYTHVSKEHLIATLQTHHPNRHLQIAWNLSQGN